MCVQQPRLELQVGAGALAQAAHFFIVVCSTGCRTVGALSCGARDSLRPSLLKWLGWGLCLMLYTKAATGCSLQVLTGGTA